MIKMIVRTNTFECFSIASPAAKEIYIDGLLRKLNDD